MGRGFPDVSLAGYAYYIRVGGRAAYVSGTSASAPTVAGFFSNINAARIAAGKGSLGFVNPALYKNYKLFTNDITSGNTFCAAKNICCPEGFYAAAGWDPATGLGSLNYGRLQDVLVALGGANALGPTDRPTVGPTASPSVASPTNIPTDSPTVGPTAVFLLPILFHSLSAITFG